MDDKRAGSPHILLLGKSGQVGYDLQRTLASLGKVTAYGREQADLADLKRLREVVRKEAPRIIVNAAAYTAVDRAESEPDLAYRINAEAPALLAEEARQIGALFVHYSTDYVFDGSKQEPYEEDDTTNPLNVYGRTKLEGEQAIRGAGGDYLVLRTSWVYSTRGRNFLLTMKRLAEEREELRVVNDQVGAPTWSGWIAEATAAILERALRQGQKRRGLYHLTAGGQTTWYDFTRAIVDHLSRQPGAAIKARRIVPINTAEYPTPAARPAYSVLSNRRLQQDFNIVQLSWQEQLAQCMKELGVVA
jgi:dTDP-4-dehydrorhamnose reductase